MESYVQSSSSNPVYFLVRQEPLQPQNIHPKRKHALCLQAERTPVGPDTMVDLARGFRFLKCVNTCPTLLTKMKIFHFGLARILDGSELLALQGFEPATLNLAYPGVSYSSLCSIAGNAICIPQLGYGVGRHSHIPPHPARPPPHTQQLQDMHSIKKINQ